MTKADAARLVAIVVTAYPNFDKFKDAKAIEATVNLWAMMFEQDESGIVALAVKKHIATNKWPPSVAEVREIMLEIQHPELIEPDKAWLAVSDLMYSAGQFNHGDLSHQLPPLVARAVESIGWTSLWEMHRSAYIGGKREKDRDADRKIDKERAHSRGLCSGNLSGDRLHGSEARSQRSGAFTGRNKKAATPDRPAGSRR